MMAVLLTVEQQKPRTDGKKTMKPHTIHGKSKRNSRSWMLKAFDGIDIFALRLTLLLHFAIGSGAFLYHQWQNLS